MCSCTQAQGLYRWVSATHTVMSSDSDERVSDHGRQIVEDYDDDVVMGGIGESGDEETSRAYTKKEEEPEDQYTSEDDNVAVKDKYDGESEDKHISSDYSPDETTDSDASTDSGVADESDGQVTGQSSRKRPRSPDAVASFQPMKKTKGSFNRDYLDLLNADIKHAVIQYIPLNHANTDGRSLLPDSQIGMVVWTSAEKEQFFEALGRLGRDNAAGIAQRVRTKSEMEVRQYMRLLHDALEHRQQENLLDPLELADIPAALELSYECCQALEAVADNIALKQDKVENRAAKRESGAAEWLVTEEKATRDEEEEEKDNNNNAAAASLFRPAKWLALSEQFFMNAPEGAGNWATVDGDTPSMRRTTLDDFHTLAETLTKRIVAASLYMAASRVRSERGKKAAIAVRNIVKEKDVQAAVLSLGLAPRRPPLMRTVRRLGLRVYKVPPTVDEETELEAMAYEDVEDMLGIDEGALNLGGRMENMALSSATSSTGSEYSNSSSDSGEEEATDNEDRMDDDDDDDDNEDDDDDASEDEEEVKALAEEATFYSAVDFPRSERDKDALLRRIKAERAQEEYAEALDAQASFQEEKRMWEMLGKQPPPEFSDPGLPPTSRRQKITVQAGYSVGKDWRSKTRVMSEWEALYQGAS